MIKINKHDWGIVFQDNYGQYYFALKNHYSLLSDLMKWRRQLVDL